MRSGCSNHYAIAPVKKRDSLPYFAAKKCSFCSKHVPESNAAVSYYVSDYIGLQISNRKKCIACKDLLLASCDPLHIADFVAQKEKKLFDIADRGGLSKPSEFCYVVTSLAVVYFSTVASDELNHKKLLCAQNSRSVFCAAATRAVSNSPPLLHLINVKCATGHSCFEAILKIAFNCFAKNQLKRLNSRPSAENSPEKLTVRYGNCLPKQTCKHKLESELN